MDSNKKDWVMVMLIIGIMAAGFMFQNYHAHVIKGANYSIYTNVHPG